MLLILDSTNRRVITRPQIVALDDIFTTSWVHINENVVKHIDEVLIDDVSSFRALKHYVAGYILSRGLPSEGVPPRYVRAYEANKHLYK